MRGKIIRGIAGFYYVQTVEYGVLECKAKGVFRKDNIKPMIYLFIILFLILMITYIIIMYIPCD